MANELLAQIMYYEDMFDHINIDNIMQYQMKMSQSLQSSIKGILL